VLRNDIHVSGNCDQFGRVSLREGHQDSSSVGCGHGAEKVPHAVGVCRRILLQQVEGKGNIIGSKGLPSFHLPLWRMVKVNCVLSLFHE
jgi:hypothetical protein